MSFKKKIAFVCSTRISLEHDDRIRKVCLSLSTLYNVNVFVLFSDNREETGTTSYGIPYKSISLKSRKYLSSGKLLFVKAYEFYKRFKKSLKDYNLVWVVDEYAFVFPLLYKKRPIIWELHEIPQHFISRNIMKRVFWYIEKRCSYIIHANKERLDYLVDKGVVRQANKHSYIHNYPQESVIVPSYSSESIQRVKDWCKNQPYVYCQGLNMLDRFPYNSVKTLIDTTNYKIVVVGGFHKEAKIILEKEYGKILSERVFFTGAIPSIDIPYIIKDAKFSIVLYESSHPNRMYCEATRLFYALRLGVPVVVGNNETMRNTVEQYQCGVVANTDGRDLSELKNAITKLLDNYEEYKQNTVKNKDKFVWENDKVLEVASKAF